MDSLKTITKTQNHQNQTNIIKTCSKHGEYQAVKRIIPGRNRDIEIFTKCPKCEEEKNMRIKKEHDFKKRISFELGLKNVGIPKR